MLLHSLPKTWELVDFNPENVYFKERNTIFFHFDLIKFLGLKNYDT